MKNSNKNNKFINIIHHILKKLFYYRELFEKHFKNHSNIIPHFWMPNPKWCNVTDPSARILDNYEK